MAVTAPGASFHRHLYSQEAAMKGIRIFAGTLMLLLLTAASSVVSQEKNSPKAGYPYDQASQQTYKGWVVEMQDFQCPVSGTMGSHITVKNESGSIQVHLAPASFMKLYEINIRKNDNITVVGSRITYEGKPALIAKSVIIGRETYNFRDPAGKPLW
jgi:hypothetical protein